MPGPGILRRPSWQPESEIRFFSIRFPPCSCSSAGIMFDAPQIIIRRRTGPWQIFLRFLRWFPDLLKRNSLQFTVSRVAEGTGLLVLSSCRFRLLQHTGVNSPGFILSPIGSLSASACRRSGIRSGSLLTNRIRPHIMCSAEILTDSRQSCITRCVWRRFCNGEHGV